MENHQQKNQKEKIVKREKPLTLSVLNLPSKSVLMEMLSPSSDFKLYHHAKKKINFAVYTVNVPKPKLFSNLEIYEWRNQTDFPIVKTHYISVRNQA